MNMNSAIVHPYDIELEHLNVADPAIFEAGQEEVYFRRLRDEAPLHYCQESAFGPYWSVTRYSDIMAVDTDHARFSSAGGITVGGAGGTPMPPKTESEQQGQESRPQFDGFGISTGPLIRVTLAPDSIAASAKLYPIFPELLFVMNLTGSIGS